MSRVGLVVRFAVAAAFDFHDYSCAGDLGAEVGAGILAPMPVNLPPIRNINPAYWTNKSIAAKF